MILLPLEIFIQKFDWMYIPEPMSGCWLWLGDVYKNGYGRVYTGHFPGERRAHRVSHLLHKGPISDGLYVLHRCDVRCCVNPAHLFLGTQQDNMDDMARKGRHPEQSKRSCTDEQVRAIRQMYDAGIATSRIGDYFGKNPGAIWKIGHRKTYRYI